MIIKKALKIYYYWQGQSESSENAMCSPELVRPTHGDVPLHGDGQGHVDGGAERDRGHGVEEVDVPCDHYN